MPGLKSESSGHIIRPFAITIYYIFNECFKRIGIATGNTKDAWASELHNQIIQAIKGRTEASYWTASSLSHIKYLRKTYGEALIQVQDGKPHAIVPLNYHALLPVLFFAGVGAHYLRLNTVFEPGRLPARYQLIRRNGKVDRISFTVEQSDYLPALPETAASAGTTNTTALLMYQVPARPLFFVGREPLLQEIHKNISASGKHHIVLLHGIGGMGKTTLLQEYLRREDCESYFERIIYVTVNKNLETAFTDTIVLALGLDDKYRFPSAEKDLLKVITGEMSKYTGTNLVVIDNVNESDFNDLRRLRNAFLQTGWKFLITTRTAPDGFFSLNVDELEESDAASLFIHHYSSAEKPGQLYGTKSPGDLQKLLDHIVRHTLLIELLAKSASKKALSISGLLERLKEQDFRHPALQRVIFVGDHAREQLNTATLHQYLLDLFDTDYLLQPTGDPATDQEHAHKVTMLRFFSVLPPLEMPLPDLKLLWTVPVSGENDFEDRLDELHQIGWLQQKQGYMQERALLLDYTYRMHRLVQEVVYEKLRPDMVNCVPLMLALKDILTQKHSRPRPYHQYAKGMVKKLRDLAMGPPDQV